jgi:hypothetical protein
VNQQRDIHINQIKARRDCRAYGLGIGVLLLDDVYPAFPGDVRNASAYPFPIQYEVIQGVDIEKIVRSEMKIIYLPPIINAAQRLEKFGVRALVGECGYLAYFQREVASSVKIPVFMSSLLQVPLAQQVVGSNQLVGILVANADYVTDHHLQSVGVKIGSNYVIGGAMESRRCREFDNLWTTGIRPDVPTANYEKAQSEFLEVAIEFYQSYPNMGAMVLECTGFPPFARALQREIEIPVFSWGTLLDYAYSIAVHRDYYGHV